MNVYTVEIIIPYEDDYVAEIFTSKEKARKYIKSKGYKYSRKEHHTNIGKITNTLISVSMR